MFDYPVMFTLRDAVSGNGFLAGVTVSGRATVREEDGQWWMHGARSHTRVTVTRGSGLEGLLPKSLFKNISSLTEISDSLNQWVIE